MALSISICDRFENYGCQRGVKLNFLRAHEGKCFSSTWRETGRTDLNTASRTLS
jgi:hypothetical protein